MTNDDTTYEAHKHIVKPLSQTCDHIWRANVRSEKVCVCAYREVFSVHNDHLDHCLSVFKRCTAGLRSEKVLRLWQRGPWIAHQLLGYYVSSFQCWGWCVCFGFHYALDFPTLDYWPLLDIDFSMLVGCFQKNVILLSPSPRDQEREGPSMRKPASREITSDKVELWNTGVCFLHIQLIGTNVWLPNMHKSPPDVDFESSRSPEKSESWNNPNLHCCAVFPTWQYCWKSFVWWMYDIKLGERLSKALVHLWLCSCKFV